MKYRFVKEQKITGEIVYYTEYQRDGWNEWLYLSGSVHHLEPIAREFYNKTKATGLVEPVITILDGE